MGTAGKKETLSRSPTVVVSRPLYVVFAEVPRSPTLYLLAFSERLRAPNDRGDGEFDSASIGATITRWPVPRRVAALGIGVNCGVRGHCGLAVEREPSTAIDLTQRSNNLCFRSDQSHLFGASKGDDTGSLTCVVPGEADWRDM